jgi:hypothetical protein
MKLTGVLLLVDIDDRFSSSAPVVGHAAKLALDQKLRVLVYADLVVADVRPALSVQHAIGTPHPPTPYAIRLMAIVLVDGVVVRRFVREVHLDDVDLGRHLKQMLAFLQARIFGT